MADITEGKGDTDTITVTVRKDFPADLRDQLVRQLEKGAGSSANFVVGNFADLQRAGAEVVAAGQGASESGTGFAAGVAMNPAVDLDAAKEGAQRTLDAEAEAKSPPAEDVPAGSGEKVTQSVDPGSVSPAPLAPKDNK